MITFYLWRRGKPIWFLVAPMVFMLIMPMWAMLAKLGFAGGDTASWVEEGKWLLVAISSVTMALEVWMIVEAVLLFPKAKGVVEEVEAGGVAPASGQAVNC